MEEAEKEVQKVTEQLHRSNSDLKRVEEEKSSLKERLQQMESHRDHLLDKVGFSMSTVTLLVIL